MRYIKGKRAAAATVCLMMILGVMLCGCYEQASRPLVKLSVWWSDDGDRELVAEIIEEFKKEHEKEALFEITVSRESVMNLRGTVLANPEAAADIFMFADDQFDALKNAGALLEISENTDRVILETAGEKRCLPLCHV